MKSFARKISSFVYRKLEQGYNESQFYAIRHNPQVTLGEDVKFLPGAVVSVREGCNVLIGSGTWFAARVETFPHNGGCTVEIGNDCYIGDMTRIWCAKSIRIGDRVLIAHNVNIFDTSTHPINKRERYEHEKIVKQVGIPSSKYPSLSEAEIIIGDDVWIGCNSILMKGISIGGGAVIGAGSVVTSDIPSNVMAAGNPAKIIKYLVEDQDET